MPSPAAQPEEGSKSIQKDLKWIRGEITELRSHVAVLENSPPRRFWAWVWREKRWCTTIALILVGTISYFVQLAFDSHLDARIDGHLNPLTKQVELLRSAVDEMRGELRGLAARSKVAEAASATPAELATRLVVVREALQALKASGDSPPTGSLQTIQLKLVAMDGNALGYWPLVFDLISYRSILITGLTSPPKLKATELTDISMSGFGTGVEGGYVRLRGTIEGVRFVNSWVEFNGSKPVALKNVHFDRCVLVFVGFDLRSPDPSLQRLGREILAANITKFAIAG